MTEAQASLNGFLESGDLEVHEQRAIGALHRARTELTEAPPDMAGRFSAYHTHRALEEFGSTPAGPRPQRLNDALRSRHVRDVLDAADGCSTAHAEESSPLGRLFSTIGRLRTFEEITSASDGALAAGEAADGEHQRLMDMAAGYVIDGCTVEQARDLCGRSEALVSRMLVSKVNRSASDAPLGAMAVPSSCPTLVAGAARSESVQP